MTTLNPLQKRARNLMSMSSVFQLTVFFGWLFAVWASINLDSRGSTLMISPFWTAWLREAEPSVVAVMLVTLPEWIAMFWALTRLRSLAKALYSQPPISTAVAGQFSKLANAVVVMIVVFVFGRGLVADLVLPASTQNPPTAIGFTAFLLLVIIVMVLRSVAFLLREACRLDEENRSFV